MIVEHKTITATAKTISSGIIVKVNQEDGKL